MRANVEKHWTLLERLAQAAQKFPQLQQSLAMVFYTIIGCKERRLG